MFGENIQIIADRIKIPYSAFQLITTSKVKPSGWFKSSFASCFSDQQMSTLRINLGFYMFQQEFANSFTLMAVVNSDPIQVKGPQGKRALPITSKSYQVTFLSGG